MMMTRWMLFRFALLAAAFGAMAAFAGDQPSYTPARTLRQRTAANRSDGVTGFTLSRIAAKAMERRLVSRDAFVGADGVTNVVTTYSQNGALFSVTNALRPVATYATPRRWSKLRLIVAAKAAGRWDALKAGIKAADLEDEWLACQYVEDGDPSFVAATNAVVAAGIATAEEIAAFLEGARDN